MKSLKVKQQQPEPEPALAQAPLLQVQGFSRKILTPSFKISNPYDLKFANKYNIHFKKTRVTTDFNSPAYKRLLKRNLKYIKHSELCTFGSRPSTYLLQKLNQEELNQQKFPMIIEKQKGSIFGSVFSCLREETDTIRLFRFLCRNNISMHSLKLFYHFAKNQRYQRKYMKCLTGIASLKIVYNSYLEWQKNPLPTRFYGIPEYPDANMNKIYHGAIAFLGKLTRISLDFTNAGDKYAHTQSFFCDIIKMVSQIPSLKAIEITMTLKEVEKKVEKLKTFTEKLSELKSLKLNFSFCPLLKDTGKIFTTILPLPTLKHLSINLLTGTPSSINCSDLADFIGSMKNLESFEFSVYRFLFDEYVRIFQAIQKLKSLKKLSVVQTGRFDNSFAFGLLFKALNTLKSLDSIKIDLGSKFDDNELNSYPQHLLKHPCLKRAKITLQAPLQGCNFRDEFFANIHRLRDKLDKFQLTLVCFPIELQRNIRKIIVKKKADLKNFSCQSADLTGHYGIRPTHFDGEENDDGDGEWNVNVNDENL